MRVCNLNRGSGLFHCLVLLAVLCVGSVVAVPDSIPMPDVPEAVPAEIEILQPGVTFTLLAEHPDLVTPTGIDVDDLGKIWLVSNQTHFRPDDYAGPEHDEILVFDRDGKNRRVFYSKTDLTMDLELGEDGWVYLAERSRILRVKDSDGDGVGDLEENVAVLDTDATYPHNGMSGLTWHPDGDLIFSLGENFSKSWTLTGNDGSTEKGMGEGGIFRCKADGSDLRRIARGFWNPFAVCVREDGEMFAVDNDPGSRPPCRLLHIVEGGDYGYQRAYGNGAVHPFVAWNGELRGTLPMILPSGEAPCGILPLGGGLIAPSWSNHRIDFFSLQRKGAGYSAERVELLRGSDDFRPTCFAYGPDGAVYVTDWVYTSYPIHGKGRLWRLEVDRSKAGWMKPEQPEVMNAEAKEAKALREGTVERPVEKLLDLARGGDAFLASASLMALSRMAAQWTPEWVSGLPVEDRVSCLLALRRHDPSSETWVASFLKDSDDAVKYQALRWIADERMESFAQEVEAMLTRGDLDYELFEAVLAASNTLRGKPDAGITDVPVLIDRLLAEATPARIKGYVLRLIPPDNARLKMELLEGLLQQGDEVLSMEVVRTLAAQRTTAGRALLATLAGYSETSADLRMEAVAGLASAPEEHLDLIVGLAGDTSSGVRAEALRALRFVALDASKKAALEKVAADHPESVPLVAAVLDPGSLNSGRPPITESSAWLKRLDALSGEADVDAGRRIYHQGRVAICATCHRHSGRGTIVGPELTFVGQQGSREAILQSILEPNREVAPQFYPTQVALNDGTIFTGILLRAGGTSGKEYYRDLTGKEQSFGKSDIAGREELKTSLMPGGLVSTLTDGELRDLLAFLMASGN